MKQYKALNSAEKKEKNKEYERKVADLFIKGIKEKNIPWLRPWEPNPSNLDRNIFTMSKNNNPTSFYKGINGLLCELTRTIELKSDDPRWATMAQIIDYNKNLKDKSNQIYLRKGVHGVPIKFYSRMYFDENNDYIKNMNNEEPKNWVTYKNVLRTYTIFNVSQMYKFAYDKNGEKKKDENGKFIELPAFDPLSKNNTKRFEPLIKPDTLIKNLGVKVENTGTNSCAYIPKTDSIVMVPPENFKNAQDYYDTLLHEVTHWTGSESRLNRESLMRYSENDKWRAKEEIVAEIGGYLLAKECNIAFTPSDNNYAYVNSWIEELQEDPCEIFRATKKAEEAKNFIITTCNNRVNKNEAKKKHGEESVAKEAVTKRR